MRKSEKMVIGNDGNYGGGSRTGKITAMVQNHGRSIVAERRKKKTVGRKLDTEEKRTQ